MFQINHRALCQLCIYFTKILGPFFLRYQINLKELLFPDIIFAVTGDRFKSIIHRQDLHVFIQSIAAVKNRMNIVFCFFHLRRKAPHFLFAAVTA